MSSLLRRQQRKIKRNAGTFTNRPTAYRDAGPEGYDVLHATKGWRHVSAARLRAQARLAQLIDSVERRMGRRP
ncbi:MAG: hypothetical protein QOH04_2607 [Sphingomonadales bacterium]|nr:hypothetical protein [Sphingomonadales bacterium]